ncbi:MAG: DUF4179 domain-containing protein, partial [Eubacteriales bacterium]|nr:DUF4179 domain-containing protein [Eubacteriales bacterium]
IVLVFSFTPAGTSAWAKAREAFMGIGQYLGNSAEDEYVTVIDQTQKKGDITFTLNEVVASNYQMRFSVTVEKDDGTIVRLRDVGLHTPLYINGLAIGGPGIADIEGYGVGPYGSKREGNRGIYFESITYSYDMPLYPEIKASFYAEDQRFDFEFTIDNKKFKEATKEVEINKVFDTPEGELHIGKLIISPIEQYITIENKDEIEVLNSFSLDGTDETGDNVYFLTIYDGNMFGARENKDDTSYELNYDVKSYTLQFKYSNYDGNGLIPVGEPFTIDIP